MTIRSTLLLAATLIPAQAESTPMTELISKLTTPQRSALTASTEQLARLYPALALLPGDSSEYAAANMEALEALGAAEGVPFDCMALGGSAASPAFYSALNKLITCLKVKPTPALSEDAAPAPLPAEAEAALNEALTELSQHSIQPTYLALRARSGMGEQMAATVMAAVHNPYFTPADTMPEGCIAGGKLNWDALLAGRALTPETKASLRKRPLYLMVYAKGRAFTLVFCEKPEDVRLPDSVADSVLSTAAGKAVRPGKAGQKPLVALHLSAAFMKAMQDSGWSDMAAEAKELAQGNAEVAESAAVLEQFCRTQAETEVTRPTTLQVWTDSKGISAMGEMDAQGRSYKPGKYRIMPLVDAASTIFYMESTPTRHPDKSVSVTRLIKAVAELYAASANAPQEPEGSGGTAVNVTVNPMAVAMVTEGAGALETLRDGLSGHVALLMDGKGKAPAFLGGEDASNFPRLGVYAGISKRELLSRGWAQVEKLLTEAGMAELPIETKQSGKATRYSIAHPSFGKNFMPNVMLVGKHLVFGSTASLNVMLLKAAVNSKGHVPGKGAVFIFRPEALAASVEGMKQPPMATEGEMPAAADTGSATATSLAEKVDKVYGTTTVDEGVYTLRLRVDFTEKTLE